ncbi:DUF6870 family protein [Eubacterium limosum]|uniref:DUF6870 family protein n=1 Tax=Eubacterium limosum TaxID=1736 RepID=UPI001063E70B|nr:hypothetical protein [Eubacterium limosum]
MTLTMPELEKMQSVDIGAVDAEELPDLGGIAFDNTLTPEERIAQLLQMAVNPYCFRVGEVGVQVEFAEDGPALQDTLADFLIRQKSGL